MKTGLIAVTVVCLLTLTFAITEGLDKKQNPQECAKRVDEVASCLTASGGTNSSAVCSGTCKNSLESFFNDCNSAQQGLCNKVCGGGSSAETVGATLFTIVSAVLVGMGN